MSVAEYTSEAEMVAAYKARIGRLRGPKQEPPPSKIIRTIPVTYRGHRSGVLPMVRSRPQPEVSPYSVKADEQLRVRDFMNIEQSPKHLTLADMRGKWREIVAQVAEQHEVTIMDIIGLTRSRPVVRARHEAMYRLRHETPLSMPEIGTRLGGRDHTTVLHGVRRHEMRIQGLVP